MGMFYLQAVNAFGRYGFGNFRAAMARDKVKVIKSKTLGLMPQYTSKKRV